MFLMYFLFPLQYSVQKTWWKRIFSVSKLTLFCTLCVVFFFSIAFSKLFGLGISQKYTQCCFMNSLIQSLLESHFLRRILCSFSLSPFPFIYPSHTYWCEVCVHACVCTGMYVQEYIMYVEGVHTTRFL